VVQFDDAPGPRHYRDGFTALSVAQKTARGVSVYSRHVNRPLGRRAAAAAYVLRVRPHQVTMLSAVSSAAGLLLIAGPRPSAWSGAAAGMALALGFVLDSADGQLARLTGTSSATGELLDHLLDCGTKLALHVAVLVAWYRYLDVQGALLLVPLVFQFVTVLLFFEGTLVGKLRERSSAPVRAQQPPGRGFLAGLALLPVDHGVLCSSFLVWGAPYVFRVVYVALLAAHALALLTLSRRWILELAAAEGP